MTSKLFKPLKLGSIELQNRVAMAPLTRFRADEQRVPLPIVAEYYAQRASVAGTLLISEATVISPQACGYQNVPGIYTQAHMDAWKKVTDAVHSKGSYIFLQLWHLGRMASPEDAIKEGVTIKSSSALQLTADGPTPEAMTLDEIKQTVQDYVQAAQNAVAAGFDGVEIHGGGGYLVDQFTQDTVNQRTDDYGGSIENRSRFALEVAEAVAHAIGAERTGIRLSPFTNLGGMLMEDPIPQFSYVIKHLDKLGLAYLHFVTPRMDADVSNLKEYGLESAKWIPFRSSDRKVQESDRLDPLYGHWSGTLLVAGGFTPSSAKQLVDKELPHRNVVVLFGRHFISTPDLVFRLQHNIALNSYDRATFYTPKSEKGYLDYPFSKEFLSEEH